MSDTRIMDKIIHLCVYLQSLFCFAYFTVNRTQVSGPECLSFASHVQRSLLLVNLGGFWGPAHLEVKAAQSEAFLMDHPLNLPSV